MANKIPRKKLNKLVRDYLPEFVSNEEDYQTFVAFMEAFYEYMEQTRGQTGSIRNLRSLNDIDKSLDEFVNYWQDTLAEHLPTAILGDKRLVLKKMRDVYLSKGTEASYKLLFRILFNDDIEIRYPGEQVLIASGGDWRELIRLDIVDADGTLFETEFTSFEGENSGARGIVDRIERTTEAGDFVWRIFYSIESKEGDFEIGERVTFSNGNTGEVSNIDDELGEYASDRSLLNTQSAIIHDGFFYQKYSYVIEAGEPSYDEIADDPELLAALGIGVWSWRNIVRKILHPAGLLLFSEFAINTRLGTRRIDLETFIRLVITSVLEIVVEEVNRIELHIWHSVDEEYSLRDHPRMQNDYRRALSPSFFFGNLDIDYQRTIPHPEERRAARNNLVSEYRYKPTGNKELPNGIKKEDFEGVYWDSNGSETSIEMVENLLGDGQITFDDLLDGQLAKKRMKWTGDSYIYKRTVT